MPTQEPIRKATITITIDTEFDGITNFCDFAESLNQMLVAKRRNGNAGVEMTDFTIMLGNAVEIPA